jgi:mono/diheme cytochrome c family protein
MRTSRAFVTGALLCGLFLMRAHAAHSQHVSELERGEHIARLVCSACHVVASDQEFPPLLRPPAPSFDEIANRPATDAQAVGKFVATTHWDMKTLPMQMPNPMLSKKQTAAVARYLVSLRRH